MSGPKHIRPSPPCCHRGLLNTSISHPTPNNTSYQEPWRTFKSPPFFILPSAIFQTHRAPCNCENHQSQQLFICCIGRNPHGGGHNICGPWPRNFNPVTVELGTFCYSSNLHGFSKKKKKKKAIDATSQINQPEGEQPDTAPCPGIVLPTPSSTVSSKYHIHQILSIRPLAFPNHQLYNLLPFDTRPRNGGAVQPTLRGDMTRRSEEVPRAIKLTKKKKINK